MKTRDFYFDLPEALIAQEPPAERGSSRLLVYRKGSGIIEHLKVVDLPSILSPGTVMVFNDSRVRKARIFGRSEKGAEFEILLAAVQASKWTSADADGRTWTCLVRNSRRLRDGAVLTFPEGRRAQLAGSVGELRVLEFEAPLDDDYLERNGHVPLPPYIRRPDSQGDSERYQTVYARETGSAAAPTAGLHFTPGILSALDSTGVERRSLTLHVGLGTFLPVRSEEIEAHHMHSEHFSIPEETASAVSAAKTEGTTVLAVGTTSLRALESFSDEKGLLRAGSADTEIFIRPGYRFRCVDALFTNFHTPESTLLMLVSAFAGIEETRRVYAEAIREKYRFFSYGDAMLVI